MHPRIGAVSILLFAACSRPASAPPASPATPEAEMTDRFADGTPDFLRLDAESDRRTFRRWFTLLAELQYYRDPARLPREIVDCAALLRFAYREALRRHDGAWASSLGLPQVSGDASVARYNYPHPLLGAALFRVTPPPFEPRDLGSGAFAQFADAQTLQRFNTHFASRDLHRALPGDLLFYRQLGQHLPFHAMIFLGRSSQTSSPDDAESYVVYHTGPEGGGPGEMRRPSVAELSRHPSPRWRPLDGNSNFLGVWRWNILREY